MGALFINWFLLDTLDIQCYILYPCIQKDYRNHLTKIPQSKFTVSSFFCACEDIFNCWFLWSYFFNFASPLKSENNFVSGNLISQMIYNNIIFIFNLLENYRSLWVFETLFLHHYQIAFKWYFSFKHWYKQKVIIKQLKNIVTSLA